jgi:glycosyltransferase involved in cell wall biosynthesis
MRVLLWHGWLLEGTGSNVHAAMVAGALRTEGHEVALVCQEPHPERAGFVDRVAVVDADGVHPSSGTGAKPDSGQVTLLRPDIGSVLPVFVFDEYEGFAVKRFVDLEDRELAEYLDRNVTALRAVARWFDPEAVIAGHGIPGAPVARRAIGPGEYVAKMHGSDIEYAIRLQARYLELAREGLEGARSVVGPSRDVLARTMELVPQVRGRTAQVVPGVQVDLFFPRARREALLDVASRLDADPDTGRGRPDTVDREVDEALEAGDSAALDALARSYDQRVPDPSAASRLRALALYEGPLVGYFGKLIPQKGVELLIEALAEFDGSVRGVIVGFGLHREHLTALVRSLGLMERVTFTGKLDHRYAPQVLAALDVLVVPSVLQEAFGMVVAEGAAAGALPLAARHSGLAEVAEYLEGAVGRPGLFSYDPEPEPVAAISRGVRRILDLPASERAGLRQAASSFVASNWTWEKTAQRLLELAR